MIAALYVEKGGVYWGLPNVDPWDVERDARAYAGPHPVVAHPPCERWGSYWYGGPGHARRELGDDGGCFAAALEAVRRWGGVLEHPAGSRAWAKFGLAHPTWDGWCVADWHGGWTCSVEQGHFGHKAKKRTWLYAVGCELPRLPTRTVSSATGVIDRGARRKGEPHQWLTKMERKATPIAFRDVLIAMAESANRSGHARSGVGGR